MGGDLNNANSNKAGDIIPIMKKLKGEKANVSDAPKIKVNISNSENLNIFKIV